MHKNETVIFTGLSHSLFRGLSMCIFLTSYFRTCYIVMCAWSNGSVDGGGMLQRLYYCWHSCWLPLAENV